MSLTIRELLTLDSIDGCELIAGAGGIDNEISKIMIMEAPDIESWMEPGQLLLTSLFGLQGYTDTQIADFFQRVAVFRCPGIIVKIKRFVDEVPTKMIDMCNQYAIPLIRIPNERRYKDILIEVMQILFNSNNRLLSYYRDVHLSFTRLALRQPTILQILQLLEAFIKNPVALMNRQDEFISATDSRMEKITFIRKIKLPQKEYMSYVYEKHIISLPGNKDKEYGLIRGQIPNIGNDYHYLLVAEQNKEVGSIDYMAIENAMGFLQMELIKKFALSELRQNYMNDLIDDLMTGKIVAREKFCDALDYLQLTEVDEYRFIVVQLRSSRDRTDETEHKKRVQRFVDKFLMVWGHALYRIRSERIVFILRVTDHDTEAFKKNIRDTVTHVLKNYFIERFDYHIGIGEPCRVEHFKKNSAQVLRAIQFASRIKTGSFIVSVGELGLYGFLLDIANETQMTDLIPSALKLLMNERPDLMQTFQTYLDSNQSIKKSADILYLHPKTIRYRLDAIIKITNVNLNDPDEMLQCNIGFRVLRMMEFLSSPYQEREAADT